MSEWDTTCKHSDQAFEKSKGLRIEGAYLNEKTSRHVLGGEVVNSWFRLVTCERTGYGNHIGKKID